MWSFCFAQQNKVFSSKNNKKKIPKFFQFFTFIVEKVTFERFFTLFGQRKGFSTMVQN